MSELTRPEAKLDPEYPIIHLPRMKKNGEYEFLPQLDTARVTQSTFTTLLIDVFVNKGKNIKLKLRGSINEQKSPDMWLDNITTYALSGVKRFNHQCRRVYGTNPNETPFYKYHHENVKTAIEEYSIDRSKLTDDKCYRVCSGIPTMNTHKDNRLPKPSMRDAFLTVIFDFTTEQPRGIVIASIGGFTKSWCEVMTAAGNEETNPPVLKIKDDFEDECDESMASMFV